MKDGLSLMIALAKTLGEKLRDQDGAQTVNKHGMQTHAKTKAERSGKIVIMDIPTGS